MDYSSVSTTSPTGHLAESFDVPTSWGLQMPSWPLPSFEDMDTALQGSASPDTSGFAAVDRIFGMADPDEYSAPFPASQQSTSSSMSTRMPNTDSLILPSTRMTGLTSQSSVPSLGGLDIDPSPLNGPNMSPHDPGTSIHVLGQYPSLLLSDDFSSPFIHRVMYNEQVPDMTTLPRTSMAICCGSAIHGSDSTRYIRRAIEAERRSLIEEFVRPS